MVGRETARRALQCLPVQSEGGPERGITHKRDPLIRPINDGPTDRKRRRTVRPPHAGTCEAALRIEMDIEAGSVHVLGSFVAELHTEMRLVWRLVLREPRVPIDPEQRPADGTIVCDEVRTAVSYTHLMLPTIYAV